jgi:hypothetical protein
MARLDSDPSLDTNRIPRRFQPQLSEPKVPKFQSSCGPVGANRFAFVPVASVPLSPISRLGTAGAPTIVFGESCGGVLGHVSVQVKLYKEPRAVIGGL